METHTKQHVSLISGDTECCDEFPHCGHNTWQAECHNCGCEAVSTDNVLGPYQCICGADTWVLLEGWVDKR